MSNYEFEDDLVKYKNAASAAGCQTSMSLGDYLPVNTGINSAAWQEYEILGLLDSKCFALPQGLTNKQLGAATDLSRIIDVVSIGTGSHDSPFPILHITPAGEAAATDNSVGTAYSWLKHALRELKEVAQEAHADGAEVSDVALINAETVLNKLVFTTSVEPMVDHDDEGGVAIEFQNKSEKKGVHIACEKDGQCAVYCSFNPKWSRARYPDGEDLVDEFVSSALAKCKIL